MNERDPLFKDLDSIDSSKVKFSLSFKIKRFLGTFFRIVLVFVLLGSLSFLGYKYANPDVKNEKGTYLEYNEDLSSVRVGDVVLLEDKSKSTLTEKTVKEYVVKDMVGAVITKDDQLYRLKKGEYNLIDDKGQIVVTEDNILGKVDKK